MRPNLGGVAQQILAMLRQCIIWVSFVTKAIDRLKPNNGSGEPLLPGTPERCTT